MEIAERPVYGPGYCRACGGYGRGQIVAPINNQADAIARCESCSPPTPADD